MKCHHCGQEIDKDEHSCSALANYIIDEYDQRSAIKQEIARYMDEGHWSFCQY